MSFISERILCYSRNISFGRIARLSTVYYRNIDFVWQVLPWEPVMPCKQREPRDMVCKFKILWIHLRIEATVLNGVFTLPILESMT